ncbi:MAG TPA: methyltransferase domain-containing protein [Chthoniobacterales bacterium]|nr:methyltransferase domain-containing protein [Chthoniobacterales bacterium]
MKRQFDPAEPELMDRPQPVTPELARDLENLRQLNRYFGSYALIRRFLRRWIKPGDRLRVLDLATGSGDIPRLVVDHARLVKASITVDAVEQQASTVEIARSLSGDYPEIQYVQGDVLTFEAESYDIVLCSLALHHFADDAAVRVLQRCRALSNRYVLVSDLERGLLASVGVWLLTAVVFREPMTRIDGRLSAQRAFSFREFRALAERAGWAGFGHRRFAFARQAIWLEPK